VRLEAHEGRIHGESLPQALYGGRVDVDDARVREPRVEAARVWGLHGADDTMPGVRRRIEVSTSLR
jgi:hypothetical protein